MEFTKELNAAACELRVNVVCTEEEWKTQQTKTFEGMAKNITLKGFRKGKAPLAQVRRAVSTSDILNRAADKIVNKAYNELLNDKEVRVYVQPRIDVKDFSEKSFNFAFIVVTAPIVTLGEYKGMTLAKESTRVTKADVEKEIERITTQDAELEVVEEGVAAKLGDTVVIDFVGYVDGKAFDGGEASNFELVLGSNTFVPGFEDQLVGVKTGEKKEVNLTFPENYVAGLSNKAAKFDVTVAEIKTKVVPTVDDEYVKGQAIEGVETVEAWKEYLKKQLSERKANEAKNAEKTKLVDTVINNAQFTIHPDLLAQDADNIVKDFTNRVESQGFSMDDYYQITKTDANQIRQQAMDQALVNAKRAYVLNEVGVAEKITVSDEEVNAKLAEIATRNNSTVEEVKKQLGDRLTDFTLNLRSDKIVDFLLANNTFASKSTKKAEAKEEAK